MNNISSALTIKQKMLQVLKDTRDHYAANPDKRRCIDEDGNCYYTWGNRHCAIGRYLKEEYQQEDWVENDMSVIELMESSDDGLGIDWCLRDDVQGLDVSFWVRLQDFHDCRSAWITKDSYDEPIGLSLIGKDKYKAIERKINMGDYDG